MSEDRVDVEDDDGVRLIAFDRPEVRNAFDAAMYRAVTEALAGALADDAVGAVVLTGRGTAFTAGQDLREMAALATGRRRPGRRLGFPGPARRRWSPSTSRCWPPSTGWGWGWAAPCSATWTWS